MSDSLLAVTYDRRIPTTERLLIINADDCGLAAGITQSVLDLGRLGAISSTSVLLNLPDSDVALAAVQHAGLAVGVHLNVTLGSPLSATATVGSLLGAGGRFLPTARAVAWRLLRGGLSLAEVEREWTAQIERCLAS
ncbi:MAG TPA: ChbG/HpnK family deacetylase, partial [Chloroflexota bacterium]|nr:ChbG/HpnK family deacetylase [Chloroflexota bacterium]